MFYEFKCGSGWPTVHLQWQRKLCRILTALPYPFCMLTIQLPSDMPTGAPPTILVLLWTKHPTDDSSPRKEETHADIRKYFNIYLVIYIEFKMHICIHGHQHLVINGDILFTQSKHKRNSSCLMNHHNHHYTVYKTQPIMLMRPLLKLIIKCSSITWV